MFRTTKKYVTSCPFVPTASSPLDPYVPSADTVFSMLIPGAIRITAAVSESLTGGPIGGSPATVAVLVRLAERVRLAVTVRAWSTARDPTLFEKAGVIQVSVMNTLVSARSPAFRTTKV